jgi:hypothetical protein
MALREPTAEASLADSFACSKLGIAIAAMISMIATTISNSMSENPFDEVMMLSLPSNRKPRGHKFHAVSVPTIKF